MYGLINDFEQLFYIDFDLFVFMDLEELDQLFVGMNVQILVVVGVVDQMIDDIYGMVFILELDFECFDMSLVEVIFFILWFGELGINIMYLYCVYDDGCIEVVLSCIDYNNVLGFGIIMYLCIIIDDIVGVYEVFMILVVNDIMGIDYDEQYLIFCLGMSIVMIISIKEGIDCEELLLIFGIFLNFICDVVYFKNVYNMVLNCLDLFNVVG